MLAPGDCVIKPAPPEPVPGKPADRDPKPTPPPAPVPGAEEAEPRSFLLTLLRALGAIHT
jgi:hypothetical protein